MSWDARWKALGHVWPIVILIVLVFGGIYSGIFPPSAAGAAGAFGALVFALFRMKRIRGWLVPALLIYLGLMWIIRNLVVKDYPITLRLSSAE